MKPRCLLGCLLVPFHDRLDGTFQALCVPHAPALPGVLVGLHELHIPTLPLVMRQALGGIATRWGCGCGGLLLSRCLILGRLHLHRLDVAE